MKVTKEVTFDCAHMLSGHNGLCKNLHGHTYKLQVGIEGEKIESGSSADMIVDFKDLKAAINNTVMSRFDHATIISGDAYRGSAEEELLHFLNRHDLRHIVLPKRTTAEDMALYIKEVITNDLAATYSNISNVSIRLYETPTSFVEV